MSNWQEFSAKTVDEALTEALIKLETTSDQIEYVQVCLDYLVNRPSFVFAKKKMCRIL